ncbi:MAG TPA: carbonic anhydrase family protein [Candidatus Sulfotelmatobacter sp.]|nr:carbonic anhydrase family protein [Candidatus Sulfotelmatobacter sp.]
MNRTASTISHRKDYHSPSRLFKLVQNHLNRLVLTGGLLLALLFGPSCQTSNPAGSGQAMFPPARTQEEQAAMTPQQALAELEAGNARFVAGRSQVRNLPAKVRATASGQYPFAVILSCVDSRQPIEIIFDQGIGDVFSARVAGNVLNDDILGSMEFACKVSGAKLIAVIGHSNCGAIKGAIDDVQLGHLTGLLEKIKPAIDAVPDDGLPRNSKNSEFVEKVAEANVRLVMQQIPERSPILRDMIYQGKIELVGGMYDLSTGEVRFFQN